MLRRNRRHDGGERRGNGLIGKRRRCRPAAGHHRSDRVSATRERTRAATVVVLMGRRVAGAVFAAAENRERAEDPAWHGDRMQPDRESRNEDMQRDQVRRSERNRLAERSQHRRDVSAAFAALSRCRNGGRMHALRRTAREARPARCNRPQSTDPTKRLSGMPCHRWQEITPS